MAIFAPTSNVASATTDSEYDYSDMLFVLQSDLIPAQTDDTDLDSWENQVHSNPASPDEATGPSPNAGVNKMRYRTGASGSAINSLPVVQGGASRGMGFNIDATKDVLANSSWTFYWAGRMPTLGAQTTDGHLWGDYQGPLGHTSLQDGQFITRLIMHAGASDVLGYSYNVQNDSGNPTTQTTTDNIAGVQVLVWVFDKSIPSCKIYRNGELIFTGTWSSNGGTWDITDDFVELFQSGDGSPDQSFYGDTTDFWGATSAHDNSTRTTIEAILMARVDVVAPNAPSSLSATMISSSQIDLTWTDNSSNEDDFLVYRSTDNVTFALAGTNAANDVTFSDTGLSPSTLYYYKVRARRGTAYSAYSNTDSETTDSTGATPIDPYTLGNQMWMFETDQIPVVATGTELNDWPDASTTPANNNDLVFPSAVDPGGTKPQYITNVFGSLPGVRVTSGDEGEITDMNPTLTGISHTHYLVVDYTPASQPDASGAVMWYPYDVAINIGGNYAAPNLCADNFSANHIEVEEDSSAHDIAAAANGKQILTFNFDKGGSGSATVRRNGVQIGTVSGLGTEGWQFEDFIAWFSVGGGGFSRFVGDVGAALAFSESHDTATMEGVEAWLDDKYL